MQSCPAVTVGCNKQHSTPMHPQVDNVLWHGKVIDDSKQDADTVAIRELNAKIFNDERWTSAIMLHVDHCLHQHRRCVLCGAFAASDFAVITMGHAANRRVDVAMLSNSDGITVARKR